MSTLLPMHKALGAAAVVAAIAVAGGIWATAVGSPGASSKPVSVEEASAQVGVLVDASRQVVSPGAAQEFCDHYASSVGLCRESASDLGAVGWGTPVGDPVVALRDASNDTVIADVSGTLSTGSEFKGVLELVRDTSGKVKAVDPVFWLDKELTIRHGTSATQAPTAEP